MCGILLASGAGAADLRMPAEQSLRLSAPGDCELRVLSPTFLELNLVNTKAPNQAPVTLWNWVGTNYEFHMPALASFSVTVNGQPALVQTAGFKRRVLYAPLARRDLRIANALYLQLAQPLNVTGATVSVEVNNPDLSLWPANLRFSASIDPLRYSPAIHVNQEGYLPAAPKKALVGYYLGDLGELPIPPAGEFQLVDVVSNTVVYQGSLTSRVDIGFTYTPKPYQQVWEANFSDFSIPGAYRLVVPGLGASLAFRIDAAMALDVVRAYALGLYHQRCGTNNTLPYTRFTHNVCHHAPASVPLPPSSFAFAWTAIAFYARQVDANNPPQIAPLLTNAAAQLYPFVNQGSVDVAGGHHDAGDYSKYTINSASLIHYLVFAVDAFPGVAALDNLGLPESGNGIPDLLDEAKWEADFLAKMQDADGGFYFLVYPRNREYESNVLPENGDPQVVWPKTTSVTAAGVAALAQCASSPAFKQFFPQEASNYLAKAQLGWNFLTNAVARHGKAGAYQKITHYGNDFTHDDELAWAACELYLATGAPQYHQQFLAWFPNPSDARTWHWGWWRMFAGYGNAIRSYAFAARSGRLPAGMLDTNYLARCETQIQAAAQDNLLWSQICAYGTSYSDRDKQGRTAGWYFSSDKAFDLTVAWHLTSRLDYLEAIMANLNYELGCNPVNVSYVTGLGWRRQREIVHQYAQNDRRVLPPTGLPLGNLQSAFQFLTYYGNELGALNYPQDGAATAPYPMYDRWADSFNVTTEFVCLNQARSLASLASLAAQTSLTNQVWQPGAIRIAGVPTTVLTNELVTVSLEVTNLDLAVARIVWEASGQEPMFGPAFTFAPTNYGPQWIEVEVQWPDGRRLFAATNFFADNGLPTVTVLATATNAVEGGVPGEFTFYRAGGDSNQEIVVQFTLSGTAAKFTDYRTPRGDMPELVVLPAGATKTNLSIVPVNDALVENTETVTLTISPAPAYNVGSSNRATLNILDNDLGLLPLALSPAGNVMLSWLSVSGRVYRVLGKDNLMESEWRDVSGEIFATGGATLWTESNTNRAAQRFYKVEWVR